MFKFKTDSKDKNIVTSRIYLEIASTAKLWATKCFVDEKDRTDSRPAFLPSKHFVLMIE